MEVECVAAEKETMNEFKNIDRSKIKEVGSIKIDTSLPVPERMKKYVADGGDLSWKRQGKSLIKITHSGSGQSFIDNFAAMMGSM